MNYLDLINKHNLRIADHRVRNDALAVMKLPPSIPGIAPSGTLQAIYDTYKEPVFFLRKEAFGWRLRIIKSQQSRTVSWQKTPYHSLEKMSILISNETYKWDYTAKQYIRKKRTEFEIALSASIDENMFNDFMTKYLELSKFIIEFINTYNECDEEFKNRIKLKKAA